MCLSIETLTATSMKYAGMKYLIQVNDIKIVD